MLTGLVHTRTYLHLNSQRVREVTTVLDININMRESVNEQKERARMSETLNSRALALEIMDNPAHDVSAHSYEGFAAPSSALSSSLSLTKSLIPGIAA